MQKNKMVMAKINPKRTAILTLGAAASIEQANAFSFSEIVASWFILVFFGAAIIIALVRGFKKLKERKAWHKHIRAGLITPMQPQTQIPPTKKSSTHGIEDMTRNKQKD